MHGVPFFYCSLVATQLRNHTGKNTAGKALIFLQAKGAIVACSFSLFKISVENYERKMCLCTFLRINLQRDYETEQDRWFSQGEC
jgi:hypothetical protein